MQKSPSFGYSYRSRNILPRFVHKSPSFGYSYRSRNILPRFVQKSPRFGYFYRSRNILPRFVSKSSNICHSYRSRNILPRFATKTLESAQQSDWYHFTVIKIRWVLFAKRLADASAERLSTVSSPFLS